jgi:hypothetical protein
MAQKGDGLMDSRVADLIICRPEIAAYDVSHFKMRHLVLGKGVL